MNRLADASSLLATKEATTFLDGQNPGGTQAPNAVATIYTVNSLADTNTGSGTAGTLRYCITQANTAGGTNTITFSVTGTITLTSSLPTINNNLTIDGPGTSLLTISGNNSVQIMTTNNGVTATIQDLTMANGNTVNQGGAIDASGSTTTVNLINCVFDHNQATFDGGAVRNNGATMNITNCTFSNNMSTNTAQGGAVKHNGLAMTITDSTFVNNAANGGGAGGALHGGTGTTNLTVTNCTFYNNFATFGGAAELRAGGTFQNCTFSKNVASATGGIDVLFQQATFINTIIAGNLDPNGNQSDLDIGSGGSINLANSFNNMIGSPGNTGFTDGVNGNHVGATDALLAPLGNYGGLTQTAPPLGNSPALNGGRNIGAPVTDQRGASRPLNGTVDIGAVEVNFIVTNTGDNPDNNIGNGLCATAASVCSLRAAIQEANTTTNALISFNLPSPSLINLSSAFPTISSNMFILGPGSSSLTISGNNSFRVFQIGSATTVGLVGLKITQGNSAAEGGGISNQGILTVTRCLISNNTAVNEGGGIANTGTLTIADSTISNNTSTLDGGGIASYGALTVSGSTFIGNSTNINGGGIAILNGGALQGSLSITNSTFSVNQAAVTGGGISFDTSVTTNTITNCTISQNQQTNVGSSGGGLGISAGTVTLKNTIIANNTKNGGSQSDITVTGGTVSASSSYNLIGIGGAGGLANGVNNNQVGVTNAGLGPLNNYGGTTLTYALTQTSVALNAGTSSGAPTTDQRGIARPSGAAFDIGAFENNVTITPTSLPTGTVGTAYPTQTFSATGGISDNFTTWILSGTLPAGLTFDAGNHDLSGTPTQSGTFQFSLIALDDTGIGGVINYTLTINPQVLDHFAIGTISGAKTAGTPFNITITAQDASNNTVVGFNGTVNLSTTAGSISPTTSGAFTNGTLTQSVTVTQSGTGKTITVNDGSGHSGTSNTFTVNAGALDHFAIGAISTQTAGIAFNISLTAQDANNNTVTSFASTVSLSTTAGTISPTTSGAFTSGTRTQSVTVTQAGASKTITVTRTAGTETGTSNTFTVNAGALHHFAIGNISAQTAGTPFSIALTAQDVNNNTVTSFTGTVNLSTTAGTISPTTSSAFTSGALNQSVTVTQAGASKTISVDDGSGHTGTSNSFTVNAGALHHFAIATISSPQNAGTAFNIALTAQDINNNTVTSFTGTVNLNTTAGTITPTTSGAFTGGARTESVTVTQSGTGKTISVDDGSSHTGTSNTFTVNPGAVHHFAIGNIAQQTTGIAFNITITAQDANNNTVTGFVSTVNLSTTAGTINPTTSGAFTAGARAQNVSVSAAGTGRTISVNDGSGHTGTSNGFTVIAPPSITAQAGVSRQQGSPISNSQIATVSDTETAAGSLIVTVTSANPSNGVTLSNIVNTNGTVTADLIASCAATNASFTLQVSDGSLTATATLNVTVTANSAPTLVYGAASVNPGGSITNPPTTASDNGSIVSYAVQSQGTYTGTISVNASGVASISNPSPVGAHTITIRATDNCGATTDATFTLTVNCVTSFTVNNAGDEPDAMPGDGICATAGGVCTLRAAIEDANALTTCAPLQINFAGGITLITLTNGQLNINRGMTINGPGADTLTISGSGLSRVFQISSATVSLNGLTITGGSTTSAGGGIVNSGTSALTVTACVVTGNTADSLGGGIANLAGNTLNVINSAVSNNISNFTGGSGGGGGISNNGTLTVTNSTISGNTKNNGDNNGGGIWSINTATIINSTITNNTAAGMNRAGGLYRQSASGTVTVFNSIIAANSSNTTVPDVTGSFATTGGGHNFIGNVGSATGFNQTGDQTGTGASPLDPLLAALGSYGGTTPTHALLPGSPAINAGTSSGAPANDQRGSARVGSVDIGAFESQGFTLMIASGNNQSATAGTAFASPLSVTVTSANSEPVNGGQVTFTPPASGASCTVAGNPATIASGAATSGTVTANANSGGPYNVAASATGATVINFSLTNTNSAPNFTPASALTRQQGSPAGAAVTVGNVSDAETAAGSLTVTQIAGGSATGITVTGITNTNGTITAQVSADCNATTGTVRFQVSDGISTGTGDLQVNVTNNSTPTLTYNNASVAAGSSTTINAATATDNGSIASYSLQNQGTYTGTISVNSGTGQVSISNATPGGAHTITIRAVDNCGGAGGTTDVTFTLTVTCPTITINPATLPNGTQGTGYSQTITPSGGSSTNYTYSFTGTLPTGVNLSVGPSATASLSGTPTAGGTFNFTITATDANGCSGSKAYTVIINALPTISAVGASRQQGSSASSSIIANVNDAESGAAGVTVTVNGGASATVNGVTVSGIVNSNGTVTANISASCAATTATFTLAATDGGGATATTTLTVTVTPDTQAPTITCPANVTQATDAGQCSAVVTYTTPTASDNCGTPTVICSPASGSTFAQGTTTVTCTATDGGNNTANCSFTVTVNDTTAPTLTCPANLTQPATAGQCSAVVTYTPPTATDNCSGVGAVSCTPASGSSFAQGTTTVTCNVTDASGNPASCSFTVTVTDTQAPTIACPANLTVPTTAGQCSAVVTYTTPQATDNCSGVGAVSCVPASGSTFAKGVTTVTCSVADAAGNPASCSFTITVNDTQNPTLGACPANINATTGGSCASVTYTPPTVSDNCPGATVSCVPPSGTCFNLGTTTVTCTATDTANNTAQCAFTVTVSPCTITCGANLTVSTDAGLCSAVVNYSLPMATGSCGTVSCVPAAGAVFPKGTTTVTCMMQTGPSCAFTVTVNDNENPQSCVTPPANMISWWPGDGNANDIQGANQGSGGAFATGKVGQAFSFSGSTLVSAPNSASLNLTGTAVTLDGWIRPTASTDAVYLGKSQNAANDYVLLYQSGQLSAIIKAGGTETTVNTGVVPALNQWTHIALVYNGATIKVYADGAEVGSTAKTGNLAGSNVPFSIGGRAGELFFNGLIDEVEVFDRALSAAEIQSIYNAGSFGKCKPVVVNATGQCSATVNYTAPDFADNCAGGTVVCVPASGTTFTVGVTTVNCTVTDAANNTFANAFTARVVDGQAPIIGACPTNINVNESAPGSGSATVTYTAPTVSDNCSGASVTCNPASGSSFSVGTTTVTCTATDAAGNTANCGFTVNVSSTCSITCPANVTVNTASGLCTAVVNYSAPTTAGTCGTVTCNPASGSVFSKGVTTVTCSTTAGPSCSFTVTVNDMQNPTLTCPANVTQSTDAGVCTAVVTYANATASDNCPGIGTPTCTPPSGSVFNKGVTTVNCSVSDASGNTTSCSFTVTVNDTTAPTLTCPANLTQPATAGQCSAVVTYTPPTATDNCSGVGAVSCTPASGSSFAQGTTTVTCNVTDASGNPASCSFTVTVTDTQAPTIACPANLTVPTTAGQCSAVVTYTTPQATDNCSGVGAVSCVPASGSTFAKGVTTVTCSVADAAGNPASCSFTITVNDTQNPTINCPASLTVLTGSGCVNVTYATPAGADNCPLPPNAVVCTPPSGSCFAVGTTTVTCTVTDASSNTAQCQFTVTVVPCVISCPANIIKENDPNQCGAVVTFAPTATAGCGTVSCSPASGTFFPKGTTTVTCGTTAGPSCSFTVTVNDTQPPQLSCPPNQTRVTALPGDSTAVVNYPAPIVSDNCPGVTMACLPPSGSTFALGVTTVTCTAIDAVGNPATCSFTISLFNACLQDDSTSTTVLLWNTFTGDYRFCCSGTVYTGKGSVTKQGNLWTLTHNTTDRRVLVRLDGSANSGSGYMQTPPGTTRCSITDRDIRNNSCLCQ
ncbi:MAG: HYR domain-containing protein [Acidobacteriota bacterium]